MFAAAVKGELNSVKSLSSPSTLPIHSSVPTIPNNFVNPLSELPIPCPENTVPVPVFPNLPSIPTSPTDLLENTVPQISSTVISSVHTATKVVSSTGLSGLLGNIQWKVFITFLQEMVRNVIANIRRRVEKILIPYQEYLLKYKIFRIYVATIILLLALPIVLYLCAASITFGFGFFVFLFIEGIILAGSSFLLLVSLSFAAVFAFIIGLGIIGLLRLKELIQSSFQKKPVTTSDQNSESSIIGNPLTDSNIIGLKKEN